MRLRINNVALDAFLDKHSAARKHGRRQKRKKPAKGSPRDNASQDRDTNEGKPDDKLSCKNFDEQSRCGTLTRLNNQGGRTRLQTKHSTRQADQSNTKKQTKRPRHISAKIQDAVFVKDTHRCTFVGTNGKRCKETRWLQIDHIIPYARGGTNSLSNLRLLCTKHNKLEAKRVYGAAKINAHRRRE